MTRMLSVEISVCCVRLYLPTEGMGALTQFQSTTVLDDSLVCLLHSESFKFIGFITIIKSG